jgi:hypothetical protein
MFSFRMSAIKGIVLGSNVLLLLSAAPSHAQSVTAFKTGEVQTGMTKQCFYNALGSQHTRTISSVGLCPLTIQVQGAPSYSYQAPQSGRSGVAFKSGEQVTGMTKQCYYSYLGSSISRTVSSVSLCPLTIPAGN